MAMHASPPKIELNPNTENCNLVLEETGQKILCKKFRKCAKIPIWNVQILPTKCEKFVHVRPPHGLA